MYLFALTYFWADEVFALDREISCNYYMVYRTYVSCNHYRIIWSQGKPLNQCFGLQCTATRTWHWQSFPLLLNHSCTYSKAIANYKVKMDEKFTDFQVTPYPSFTPSCIIGLLSSLHVGFKSWNSLVNSSWTANAWAICQWKKNIWFEFGQLMIFGVLFGECGPRLPKLPKKQETIAKKAP